MTESDFHHSHNIAINLMLMGVKLNLTGILSFCRDEAAINMI